MSNTNITTTTQTTNVTVQENTVLIELNNVGLQGVPGANNDPTYVTVRNATGATLAKGTIVYISGANGNNVQVTPALATGDSTSARTLGWLAADIANNGSGLCMVEGYLEGLNTQGFTAGAQLYLSGTVAGGFTATKPVAPTHLVYVGVVTKVSAGDGHVFVKVQNGYELEELHNVQITNPTNAQVLAYDSVTQLWKNATNAPDGVTSITAVSPLTGGTITSTGSIGLDQTALSLTRSQISDFTSGTVASAGTAQQAGTAVYSVNSGTAVYATTSGTAVFASNASTAVNLSGSITKSQVSDFTSGTVSSADVSGTATYAINSGTATYSDNSGTAVTISGNITKSQVSDFTSGTVTSASTAQQAGTAVYATNAGTAVYATTSGTAVYSTNSGTAVFATNASTAVTISGSITQSQVTGLVADLAGKASTTHASTHASGGSDAITIAQSQVTGLVTALSGKANLAGGNNLTGVQTISGGSSSDTPLMITGANPQNDDFFRIRRLSDSLDLVRVTNTGVINTRVSVWTPAVQGNNGVGGTLAFPNAAPILATPQSASTVVMAVRGAASQSANLQEWQNSAGVNLGRFDSAGNMVVTGALRTNFVTNIANGGAYLDYQGETPAFIQRASGAVGLRVQGAASQTANLQEWQNSAGTVLGSVNSSGVNTSPRYQTASSEFAAAIVNGGGFMQLRRVTATVVPGAADYARLYFVTGTNAGTLKLVVRAGTAGAETTILDNIPQ